MNDKQVDRMLDFVAVCEDPKQLRQIANNAHTKSPALHRAATLRLYEVLPSEQPGTLEYDVWHSIHALEGSLTDERGKTTRFARTRQKIKRDGEAKTVADLVLGNQSAGFDLLVERDMPSLTFEALALKHPDVFDENVRLAASERLAAAGIDLDKTK